MEVTVDVFTGDSFEFRLVFVVRYWLVPLNVRYPDSYVGVLKRVALLFACRSVTVLPAPEYDEALPIS